MYETVRYIESARFAFVTVPRTNILICMYVYTLPSISIRTLHFANDRIKILSRYLYTTVYMKMRIRTLATLEDINKRKAVNERR